TCKYCLTIGGFHGTEGNNVYVGFMVWSNFTATNCCFFFQAEDGIRDGHVTGVQTCALPIFTLRPRVAFSGERLPARADILQLHRSEERRVGKELRSRWARFPLRKNRFGLPSRVPMIIIVWMVVMMVFLIASRTLRLLTSYPL